MILHVPLSLWLKKAPLKTRNRALFYKTYYKIPKDQVRDIISRTGISAKIISNLARYSELGWEEWLEFPNKIQTKYIISKPVDIEIAEEVFNKLGETSLNNLPRISIASCLRLGLMKSGEKIEKMIEGKDKSYARSLFRKTFSDFSNYRIGRQKQYVLETEIVDLIKENENNPDSELFVRNFELNLTVDPRESRPFFHQVFSNIPDKFFIDNWEFYSPHLIELFPYDRDPQNKIFYHFDLRFFLKNWESIPDKDKEIFWCHFPFLGEDLNEFPKHGIPINWELLSTNVGSAKSFYKEASSNLDWKRILLEFVGYSNSVTGLGNSKNNNYWQMVLNENPQKAISVFFSLNLSSKSESYEEQRVGRRLLCYFGDNYPLFDFSNFDFEALTKMDLINRETVSLFLNEIIPNKTSEIDLSQIEEIIVSSDVYSPSSASAKFLNWKRIKERTKIGPKRNQVNRIIRDLKKEGLWSKVNEGKE